MLLTTAKLKKKKGFEIKLLLFSASVRNRLLLMLQERRSEYSTEPIEWLLLVVVVLCSCMVAKCCLLGASLRRTQPPLISKRLALRANQVRTLLLG
jgi:hypothetical protein